MAKAKEKKYLILTSSGGGGHTNAAEARKNELRELLKDDIYKEIVPGSEAFESAKALRLVEIKKELEDKRRKEDPSATINVSDDEVRAKLSLQDVYNKEFERRFSNLVEVIDLMGEYPKAANAAKVKDGVVIASEPWVPTYSVFNLDPIFSGKENTEKWNASQKEGTEEAVRKLEALVEMQPLAEAMQADEVHKNLLKYLNQYDVQEVYNTQALSTPAICQAVVDYNQAQGHSKHQLHILTTVTDLITHRAEHFLSSLGDLTDEQRKVLTMEIAAAPLLDPGETQPKFYKKYGIKDGLFVPKAKLEAKAGRLKRVEVNATEETVAYPSPVQKSYLDTPPKGDPGKILIKAATVIGKGEISAEEDKKQTAKTESAYITEQLGDATSTVVGNDITIDRKPGDKLITITMGSQGSNSVIEYMEAFKHQVADLPPGDSKVYLCILAGKRGPGSLYDKAKLEAAEIMESLTPELRERVKILPLAFQDAKHMTSLLNNSDILITRSGGMSSMEAEATNGRNPNRQVYVHSEAKLKYPDNFPTHSYDANYEALMKGTVKWEGGNAEYLLRKIGASLGSPETVNFGLATTEPLPKAKENSLFHFAYDGKLTEKNLAKIEQLIREGANPNLKFAGGSYLIDHCKDYKTKELLVKYGARITEESLKEMKPEEAQELREIQSKFDPRIFIGNPEHYLRIDGDSQKEAMAYSYLHPFEPRTFIDQIIVSMDQAGDFINNKILRINAIHDALDGTRMYLKTDPTAIRSVANRLRQLRNFTLNAVIFIAKQPVNMVVKPIAFASNLVKLGLVSFGMLINEAKGEKSNICSYSQFKETGKKAGANLKESLIAWGTAALVFSGFGAPVAVALFGSTMSISLGAAHFGAANTATAGLNTALVQTVGMTSNPAVNAVMMSEGVAEWGIVRPMLYTMMNPQKLFYEKEASGLSETQLNSVGEQMRAAHQKAANPENDISMRRDALEEGNRLNKLLTTKYVLKPLLKTIISPLKDRSRD